MNERNPKIMRVQKKKPVNKKGVDTTLRSTKIIATRDY